MLGTAPPQGTARASAGGLGALAARLSASPAVRRVAGGAAWSLAGAALARALALGATVLLARELGAVGFGEYNLVLATAGMLQALTGFGLGETATRWLAGPARADPDAAGRVVALSVLVAAALGGAAAAALAAAAPWLSAEVLRAPALAGALRAGAPLLVLGPIGGALLGVLAGLERFRDVAAVSAAAAAASVPLLVLGARAAGTTGAVLATVLATGAGTALYAWAALRAARAAGVAPRWAGAARAWRVLLSFSVPATLSNLLLAPVAWATAAILSAQPGGLRELGIFSAASQWRNAIVLVATSAGAALLPLFARLHDGGSARAFSRAFWASLAAVGLACLAAAGALSALAPAILRAYGPEFAGAAGVLVHLAAAGACAAAVTVAAQAIAGAGRMWLSLGLNLAWASVLVALAWALRGRGAEGLSLAHLVAWAVHLAASVGAAALLVRKG
jgi:O-antigen/teichoic acid export membrane protein